MKREITQIVYEVNFPMEFKFSVSWFLIITKKKKAQPFHLTTSSVIVSSMMGYSKIRQTIYPVLSELLLAEEKIKRMDVKS